MAKLYISILENFVILRNMIKNKIKYGTIDMFSCIEVEISSKCNRKCVYCPNSKYSRGDHKMRWDMFKKIVNELAEIDYSGEFHPHLYSEPLLDARLSNMLKYLREKCPKVKIIIHSNGDYLDQKMIDKLWMVDKFRITDHGGLRVLPKDKRISVKVLEEQNSRGGLVKPPNREKPMKFCFMNTHYFWVDFRGNVILCCNDYFSKHVFGNVKKESIIDIHDKPRFKMMRASLRRGRSVTEMCRWCLKSGGL